MAVSPAVRAWISRAATGLATVLGFYFLWRITAEIGFDRLRQTLASFDASDLAILLALPLVTYTFITARLYLVLKVLGAKVPVPIITAFSMAGTALSQVIPGGEITDLSTRAFLLGRSGLPTSTSILAVVIDGFIRFVVNSVLLFVVAATLLLAGFQEPAARTVLLVGLGVAAAILVLLAVILSQGTAQWFIRTASRIGRSRSEQEVIEETEQEFVDFFRSPHPLTLIAFLVTAAGFLWEPIQVAIILKFLNISLPFWQIFWLYHALLFPRIIPIPAGLGVSEEGAALFAQFIGQGGAVGLTVSLLSRLRSLPYIVAGLLILPFAGFIKIKSSTDHGLQSSAEKQ